MKTRSKVAAAVLAFFLGAYGVHCFYLGDKKMGGIRLAISLVSMILMYSLAGAGNSLSMLFSLIITAMGIWALVDFIQILRGKRTDADGNALV